MVRELLRHRESHTWDQIKVILELELDPYTQNSHYLQVTKAAHLGLYKAARAKPVIVPFFVSQSKATISARRQNEQEALAALAKLGIHGLKPEDLGKLQPPDVYEEELEVMAEVRAYFQVAYKVTFLSRLTALCVTHFGTFLCCMQRVIDYVPMMIDKQFLHAFKDALQGFLIEKLGLGTQKAAARCALYLAEDPGVVAQRDEQTQKKERLLLVQADLDNFALSFGA